MSISQSSMPLSEYIQLLTNKFIFSQPNFLLLGADFLLVSFSWPLLLQVFIADVDIRKS